MPSERKRTRRQAIAYRRVIRIAPERRPIRAAEVHVEERDCPEWYFRCQCFDTD